MLAREYNAELIAIHVISPKLLGFEYTPQPMLVGLPTTPSSVNNIVEMSKREAERWLDRIKQQLLADKVKLKTEVITALKPLIAGEIVDYAQEKDVDLHCLTKLRIVVTVIVHYVFSLGPQFDII